MKLKARKTAGVLLLIALLCTLAFIWANSLAVSEISNAASGAVAGVIKPVVDPGGQISVKTFGALVRKAAHMLEFGILGCILMSLTLLLTLEKDRPLRDVIGTPLLIALMTAVIDEFVQSFTGRTSSLKDVLIDFAGSVAGILLVGALCLLVRAVRRDVSWKRLLFWLLALLTILTTAFIWGNSLQSPTESSQMSGWVLPLVEPILEVFVGQGNVTEHLVRKLAHFSEFGLLGCELAILALMHWGRRLQAIINCLFAALSVAVLDETLQIISKRGSQVRDVILDFAGAATGILLTVLLFTLLSCLIASRKKTSRIVDHPSAD